MTAAWASVTSRGGRPGNQDDRGDAEASGSRAFVVADGLGGHAAGERASRAAVEAILEDFRSAPQLAGSSLRRQFAGAQRAIRAIQRDEPETAGCRTTAVVLLLSDGRALWGHIGDTRLYQLRAGRVAAVTLDHSVPQALVRTGEIRPEDIRSHPDRNRLLRALGGDEEVAPTLVDEPAQLEAGDAFLLCSDGFWEWVTEQDMEETLAGARDPADWLDRMERILLERASGPYDNYTATAVFIAGAGVPEARWSRVLAWAGALLLAAAAALWLTRGG